MEHQTLTSSEGTAAVIDMQSLLTPLSNNSPCGEDLIYSETYDAIKEARRHEDANLPQGEWVRELKRADWPRVVKLCERALATSSKDLQIAAWLTEALLSIHGPKGLHEGLTLMLEMTRTFWDAVNPLPEGDMDKRTAPFRWVNTKLAERIKFIAITEPDTNQGQSYTYADWTEAEHLEHLGVKDKNILYQAEKEGKASREGINQAAAASSASFYSSLTNEIAECLETIRKLEKLLDTLCEKDSPGFGALREGLQSILNRTVAWSRMKISTAETDNNAEENAAINKLTSQTRLSEAVRKPIPC